MSPELVQSVVEAAARAAGVVGPAGVLVVLRRLSDLADDDVRSVAIEARQLASGDVDVLARPEYVTRFSAPT